MAGDTNVEPGLVHALGSSMEQMGNRGGTVGSSDPADHKRQTAIAIHRKNTGRSILHKIQRLNNRPCLSLQSDDQVGHPAASLVSNLLSAYFPDSSRQ